MSYEPIYVGSKRQLFIDDYFIESCNNIKLKPNPPIKTGEVCLRADSPWEHIGVWGCWTTVLFDERENLYKMWYPSFTRIGRDSSSYECYVCYAISRDGSKWIKPKLGIYDFRGSRDNNIVFGGPETGFSGEVMILRDCVDRDRTRRYKMYYKTRDGLNVAFSSDGVRWRVSDRNPVLKVSVEDGVWLDTQNVVLWDDRVRKYVAYVRMWVRKWANIRVVGRSESDDPELFPKPTAILEPDEEDPENLGFYNSAAIKYPYAENVYLMFPSAYYTTPNDSLDIQLAVSRDGVKWRRYREPPFVRLGMNDDFDSRQIYMGVGMVKAGDRLWMYYGGFDWNHNYKGLPKLRYTGVVSRLILRLDGFVSADAGYRGGELTTKPIIFSGDHLILNVDTSAGGTLKVEMQDVNGKPIKGFSKAEADILYGNSTHMLVTWNGRADVSRLRGKTIKLKF